MVVQDVFQRGWETWRWGTLWPATGSWQWPTARIIKGDPLITTREDAKEPSIWSKLKRWKSSISGCLMSYRNLKKIIILSSLILCKNRKSFLDQIVTCNKKWIFGNQQQPAQWLDSEALKHFPKPIVPQTHTWSLLGGLLQVWSTTASWTPGKPLCLRSMLHRSMRYTENCNPCGWRWSIVRAQFFPMTRPDCTEHNRCFRSWSNWPVKIYLLRHINQTAHQSTTTSSSILTTLCRENASTNVRKQKMLSKSLSNPEAQIFILQE